MSIASEFIQAGIAKTMERTGICPQCENTGLTGVGFDGWPEQRPGVYFCGCPAGQIAMAQWRETQLASKAAGLLSQANMPVKCGDYSFADYAELARKQKASGPGKVKAAREVYEWTQRFSPSTARAAEGRKPWLYLHGPTGTGKTGLGCCALKEFVGWGGEGRFISTYDMLSEIKKRFKGDTESYVQALADVDVLMIDELHPGQITQWRIDILFALLLRRDGSMKPTIMTCTLGLDNKALHDAITSAGVRRILENSLVVKLDGNPLRFGE